MRTVLSQDHASNLRDFILNYDVNSGRIIDFTYGKGGLWKANIWPNCKKASFWEKYGKFELIRCDAEPDKKTMTEQNVNIIRKDLTLDSYKEFYPCDVAVFDPPYKYGAPVFDYDEDDPHNWSDPMPMQQQGKNSWRQESKFSQNKNPSVFVERVKGLNRAALECLKLNALLFVKVMDVRDDGKLVLNHDLIEDNLTNFECHAVNVYLAGGSRTWTNHAEVSHGYWQVFRMIADKNQGQLT